MKRIPMICGARWRGGFWIRVFGYGIRVVDRKQHPPVFSERMGLVKVLRIGRYSIGYLPKADFVRFRKLMGAIND